MALTPDPRQCWCSRTARKAGRPFQHWPQAGPWTGRGSATKCRTWCVSAPLSGDWWLPKGKNTLLSIDN